MLTRAPWLAVTRCAQVLAASESSGSLEGKELEGDAGTAVAGDGDGVPGSALASRRASNVSVHEHLGQQSDAGSGPGLASLTLTRAMFEAGLDALENAFKRTCTRRARSCVA